MSISRQQKPRVRGYSITHPPGRVLLPTQPGWDYLVFAHAGIFTAITDSEAWTIPANSALSVPDGARVRIETSRRVAMRCLYLDRGLDSLGKQLRVINLAPLARELVTHAIAGAPMAVDEPVGRALITLLTERLASEPDAPLQLALPNEATAREVAESIMREPAVGLDHHIRAANASRRTIERRFVDETLMSLGQWRRRARILAGVNMLGMGDNVTHVSIAVGYASPSAFVSAFRSELGSTPREFMQK